MKRVAAACLAFLLTACGEIQLAERPPQPVDLNGDWVLDFVTSEIPDLLSNDPRAEDLSRRPRSDRQMRRRFAGSALSFIAHDFQVLKADKLFIEQGVDSLGIQYEPGVYRDVSWGERDRGLWQVYAGWEGQSMVIISTADDMRVVERFTLVSPQTLKIMVSINADGEDREIARVFDRRK